MIQISLFGIGRIGRVHCEAVASIPGVKIKNIFDIHREGAEEVAKLYGANSVSEQEALDDPEIDGIIIASPSSTHCRLIREGIQRNKAVFCEKPIGSDIEEVKACVAYVKEKNGLCSLGFNRRYDPSFFELKTRLKEGKIGNLETLHLTSRDPGLPSFEYLKHSGGIFRDMMIHDLDIARWILDEEPTEIYAVGECLTDPRLKEIPDYDTASVTLKTSSGKICTILNNRRATYGYDQRVEALGSLGMLQVTNKLLSTVVISDSNGVAEDNPQNFFMDRYKEAYRIEICNFIESIQGTEKPRANETDGMNALILADAAGESARTGKPVKIDYPC